LITRNKDDFLDFSEYDKTVGKLSSEKSLAASALEARTVAISHGDKYSSYLYKIYTSIIRNKIILQIINFLDFNNWISKFAEQKLANKKICKKFDFDYSTRLQYYNANLIIEGHFHQNIQTSNYINLPSFACNQKFLTQIML